MVIDISEIVSTVGKTVTLNIPIEMETFTLNGCQYDFLSKEPVRLILGNIGKKEISLTGEIHAVLSIPCDRCLTEVPVEFSIDLDKTIDFEESDHDLEKEEEEEEEFSYDELSFLKNHELDVERLVSDEILVHFPMKTLCREDCKGLCPVCGQNLNLGECGCNRESVDPRMAAIQDIFKKYKEVE